MSTARNFCQRTTFAFCTEQPVVTCERIRLQDTPEGGGGVAPGVSPCLFGEYANQTAGGDDEPALRSSRTYVQMRPVFRLFSGPVPVPLPVCRQCEACGYSSHNDTGHHSAASLTGSTRQPSWRVMHGSVRHPVGQRFHSDDTVAGVRSIFPVNTRASNPGPAIPRSIAAGRRRCFNDAVTFCTGFFLPVLCGSLSERCSPVPVVLH